MYEKLTIIGRLGRDPEKRFTTTGKVVTNLSVAVNRQYNGADGNAVKETTWFKVTAWNTMAENAAKYLKKGSKVLVEGRLQADEHGNPRIWQRQDGSAASSFEVTANEIRYLDPAPANGPTNELEPEPAEEIPF